MRIISSESLVLTSITEGASLRIERLSDGNKKWIEFTLYDENNKDQLTFIVDADNTIQLLKFLNKDK